MKCRNCGSTYTHFVKIDGDPNKLVRTYHCDSCNRDFKVTLEQKDEGEWIATVYGLKTFGEYDGFAKIIKKPDGTIVCHQKKEADGKTTYNTYETVPELTVKYDNGMFPGYQLWYSSYAWPNDPMGTLFIVTRVELGPKLKALSKTNEALRILGREDYLEGGTLQDARVLNDSLGYLRSAIGAPQPKAGGSGSTGGCYVATCVYGSYDCPQVWTLRRYRDNTLAKTLLGRLFIRTYYAVSPTIVKWFGKTAWFKKLWKGKLDRMVAKLQAEGVEATPYDDRPW